MWRKKRQQVNSTNTAFRNSYGFAKDTKEDFMKVPKRWILRAAPLAFLIGLSAMAIPKQEVRWESFVGNIRTGAAGTVGSGTGAVLAAAPWVTTGGGARVDLATGDLIFQIHGLVLADTNSVGTPGNYPEVFGTLVL
jgi:hypothetical protein